MHGEKGLPKTGKRTHSPKSKSVSRQGGFSKRTFSRARLMTLSLAED